MNNSLLLHKLMMPEYLGMDAYNASLLKQTILDAVNYSAMNAVYPEPAPLKDFFFTELNSIALSPKNTDYQDFSSQGSIIEQEISKF